MTLLFFGLLSAFALSSAAAPFPAAEQNFQTGLHALRNKAYRTGFEILAPLAKQGDKRAQYCIGLLYAQGNYLPQDFSLAKKWYALAAEQGHTNAQNNLGLLLKQGRGGPQDLVQAYIWFDIAAENGNINAFRNRENVKQALAPEQLALARNLAHSWRPGAKKLPTPDFTPPRETSASGETAAEPTPGGDHSKKLPAASKILRVALPSLPDTADPQRTSVNAAIARNIYDRLVEYAVRSDGVAEIVPGLAKSWRISGNGKAYTFTLRANIRFHNGAPVTARDVVYTFERLLAPATGSYNARLFQNIRSVNALDTRTVRITLKTPYAPLPALLATPWASILNEQFTRTLGDAYGRSPATTCGSGPFILRRFSGFKGALLAANPDYFRGPAQIDGVSIRPVERMERLRQLFKNGELDILDTDAAPELLPYFRNFASWKDRIVNVRRMNLLFVTLNQKLAPFNDVRVRKAFLHAIDRKRLLATLFRGQGELVNGVLPAGMLCTPGNTPKIRYDPQRSRRLLKEAGQKSTEMTLVQVNQWSDLLARLNKNIKEMAEQAGFSVCIASMDESEFFDLRDSGKAPSYVQLWEADFNDPDTFFSPFFTSPGTRKNSLNYANKQTVQKIRNARAHPNQRCKRYHELERRIVDKEAAWLPLFSLSHAFILSPRVEHLPRAWNGGSYLPYYQTRLKKDSPPKKTPSSQSDDAAAAAP